MTRPRLLDLYCGAGGAAVGYHRAGFDVVGVDISPQPHYPFPFAQADALYPTLWRTLIGIATGSSHFDAIHASPPCQEFTVYRNARPGRPSRWPNLIPQTRELLAATGLPYVIENVPRSPLIAPTVLCGTSFNRPIRRHRLFETNWLVEPIACRHDRFTERRFPGSSNRPNGRTVCNVGEYRVPLPVQLDCMGVDWPMTLAELSESVPPCFTEYLGLQLRAVVRAGSHFNERIAA